MSQHHIPVVKVSKEAMCLMFILGTRADSMDYITERELDVAIPIVPEMLDFAKVCHDFFRDGNQDSFMIMVEGANDVEVEDCPVIEVLAGEGKE